MFDSLKFSEDGLKHYIAINESMVKLCRAIVDEAQSLRSEDRMYSNILPHPSVGFELFEDGEAQCRGEETWPYGGYQEYFFTIPKEGLIDPEKYLETLKSACEEYDMKIKKETLKNDAMEKKKKREQYLKLKEEFENGG